MSERRPHNETHFFGDGCAEAHGRVLCDLDDKPHLLDEGRRCRNPRAVYEGKADEWFGVHGEG